MHVNKSVAHLLSTSRFKSGGIQAWCCKHVSCAVRKHVLQNIAFPCRDVTGDIGIVAAVAAGLPLPETGALLFGFHQETAAANASLFLKKNMTFWAFTCLLKRCFRQTDVLK